MTLAPAKDPTDGVGTPALGVSTLRVWEAFIDQYVHPVKVAVVEALLYIGEPLSAAQLAKLFSGAVEGFREPTIRYHLGHLVETDILEIVPYGPFDELSGREKFVYLTSRVSHVSDLGQSY